MFDAIGTPVVKLKRERFAFLDLTGLNAGEFRELTAHEVKQLRVLAETGKIVNTMFIVITFINISNLAFKYLL